MKKFLFKNNPRLLVNSILLVLIISLTLATYVLSQRNRQMKNEQVASKPDEISQVEGVATEIPSPTPTLSAKGQNTFKKSVKTPSPTPQVATGGGTNESTNSSPTASPTPQPTVETTPTPTPEPTATPTPDTTPFEATLDIEKDLIIITANKPLQKCEWVMWVSPTGPETGGDGTINGNVCTIENNYSTWKFGAQVVSTYGEIKILGDSPPNYW